MEKERHDIQSGNTGKGDRIHLLNEREIRAAAGILFVLMFLSLMFVAFENNFTLIRYVVCIFFTDLLIRVFLSARLSPFLIIGRLIVSRQNPEWVNAKPKKFAWKIGIAIAGTMFYLLVVLNSPGIITTIGCFMCLTFLFFETAFGICLGCVLYGWFYKVRCTECI